MSSQDCDFETRCRRMNLAQEAFESALDPYRPKWALDEGLVEGIVNAAAAALHRLLTQYGYDRFYPNMRRTPTGLVIAVWDRHSVPTACREETQILRIEMVETPDRKLPAVFAKKGDAWVPLGEAGSIEVLTARLAVWLGDGVAWAALPSLVEAATARRSGDPFGT